MQDLYTFQKNGRILSRNYFKVAFRILHHLKYLILK